jgi:uracil-DNA glycosylase
MSDARRDLHAALELETDVFGPYVPIGPTSAPETAPAQPVVEVASDPVPDVAAPPSASDASVYDQLERLIPPDSPLHGFATLAEVEAYVRETVLIPLDKTRQNPVFGVGNPSADLMVIGEAPGADEDRLGEPFVGRAGQLLDKILLAIGFPREEVYIANILKSRPPNNRDPLPEEIAAHLPMLLKQIALIRPKIILCVGKTAGNSLLGQAQTLASMRGTLQDFHGLPVVVTYHPAALLRNPNWKRPTWEDVQFLRAEYDRLTTIPTTAIEMRPHQPQ